jgi:uncharacterized coiled-coil protein SlyX
MKSTTEQLVDDYLKRLKAETADLPRARRRELVEEISEHIAEARANLESENEAEVRNLLERLGEPADIAAEAAERPDAPPRTKSGLDVVALVLLLVGGVVLPLVGWLIGVVLLWVSETWTTREKLIGTLVVPGGLALPLFLGAYGTSSELCVSYSDGPVTCSGGPSLALKVLGAVLLVVLLIAPLATTVYLARRRSRSAVPA